MNKEQENTITRAEHQLWLDTLTRGIKNTLDKHKAKYQEEQTTHYITYQVAGIPKIGNYTINIPTYEQTSGNNPTIETQFETFSQAHTILPFQEKLDHQTGKYTFQTHAGKTQKTTTEFLDALKTMLDLDNIIC